MIAGHSAVPRQQVHPQSPLSNPQLNEQQAGAWSLMEGQWRGGRTESNGKQRAKAAGHVAQMQSEEHALTDSRPHVSDAVRKSGINSDFSGGL